MFGQTTNFVRGVFALQHTIISWRAWAFIVSQCSGLLFLLVLLSCTVAAADEESLLSAGMSAKGETESQKYGLIQPNLRLLKYDGKESSQIMRLLASSTNENEVDINDQRKAPTPLSAVSTTVAAQRPSSHDRWPYFYPFGVLMLRKEDTSFLIASG